MGGTLWTVVAKRERRVARTLLSGALLSVIGSILLLTLVL